MKTDSLSSYEDINERGADRPPVCAFCGCVLEPREGLPKNAAIRAYIGGLGESSIYGGKKEHNSGKFGNIDRTEREKRI